MLVISTHESDRRMTDALKVAVERNGTPGWAIVTADRRDMLKEAVRLKYKGYRLAHVAAGDTAHDDPLAAHPDHRTRNAISMLCDVHFAANQFAADNLTRMGLGKTTHVTGLPSLDEVVEHQRTFKRARISGHALVQIHPDPTSRRNTSQWVSAAREVAKAHAEVIEIVGNGDGPGGTDGSRLSLPDFLAALSICSVFITNSSAGRIEAPILGTSVIEIGNRQAGRAPMGTSWAHPEGKACEAIAAILREVCK